VVTISEEARNTYVEIMILSISIRKPSGGSEAVWLIWNITAEMSILVPRPSLCAILSGRKKKESPEIMQNITGGRSVLIAVEVLSRSISISKLPLE